jgi:PKD repeat protein
VLSWIFAGLGALGVLSPVQAEAPAPTDSFTEDTHELIVLLASGPGVPTPEEVVDRARRGLSLPADLGIGGPTQVRFVIPSRDRHRIGARLERDPEGPQALLERYLVFTYPVVVKLEAIQVALERNPQVLHVGENRRIFLSSVIPSDPLFSSPADPPNEHQWGSYLLSLPDAWERTRGHAWVGVIDTGIDADHPDLRTFHASGSSTVYDGGNFRPHLSYDYAYLDSNVDEGEPQVQNEHPRSVSVAGHGTHVSGIVGATANNETGVAGSCWNCSLIISKVSRLKLTAQGWANDSLAEAFEVAGINGAINRGAQVINLSFGLQPQENPPDCSAYPENPSCLALDLARRRDIVIAAAAGNDGSSQIDFPASDPRVLAVGGLAPGGDFWNDCATTPIECGSNYSPNQFNTPAKQVLSTFYEGIPYFPSIGCDASALPLPGYPGYGPCTGTSMSSPYLAGAVGLLRSINPLLSRDDIKSILLASLENPPGWNPQYGMGKPNVASAADKALGKAANTVLANRLTPLFSMYSPIATDLFYTTVPQMGAAANWSDVYYYDVGPDVRGYGYFPDTCYASGCPTAPSASAYIFTTDRWPNGYPLVPLYRMTFDGAPDNPNNRDSTYTTEPAGILFFKGKGYELDGIEGYIYQGCTPEPSCIPAGAVRLYRMYNSERDDYAVFPESELAQMQAAGYAAPSALNPWIGYVYPNVDSDFDNVIDGFEGLIGTGATRSDSDCDGLSDGAEILVYPYTDPLVANSGPGCVPPVARFAFTCSGLSCSLNASSSTDNVGITSYSWSFGDSTSGFGVTPSHPFGATGVYTVTLTVTDTHGLQSSTSKKVSVNGAVPLPAEGYFPVSPCRLVDTRNTTPLTHGEIRVFSVSGSCGVPSTAKAVSFNVTVVSSSSNGNLVFYPGNQTSSPFIASVINFASATSARANNAVLRLATDGSGTVAVLPTVAQGSPGHVDLILDVDGYFSEDSGGLGYQTLPLCRLHDTNTSTPVTSSVIRSFDVDGLCGIPAGAPVAALNLAIVTPTEGGFATLFQAGIPVPPVSTINFMTGTLALANGARTRLAGAGQDVSLQYIASVGATTRVILDTYGYFASSAPLKYRPVTPCRAVDTRFAESGGPILTAGQVRNFQIQGNCGVPVGAKAAMLNIAAITPSGQGNLMPFASGTPVPAASILNFHPNQGPLANGTIVPLSTSSDDLSLLANISSTHVIVDVFGYFQ